MTEIFYPIERLFANPRIFFAIANYLGGPDVEVLKDAFYELLEYGFNEYEDIYDTEFGATEVCFRMNEAGLVDVVLDTGLTCVLQPQEGDNRAHITNDFEMAATTALYDRIITAIVEANPDFKNNIALCSPPTPGNSYLRSSDGDRFEGSFHLLTDPEHEFTFLVDILDVQSDLLKATYKSLK